MTDAIDARPRIGNLEPRGLWTTETARAAALKANANRLKVVSLRRHIRRLCRREPGRLDAVAEEVLRIASDGTSRYWPEALAFLSQSLDGDKKNRKGDGAAFNVTIQNALQARLPSATDAEPVERAVGVEARALERADERASPIIDVAARVELPTPRVE